MSDNVPGFETGFWEDLRFPVQAINPPGQVSDPDIESDSGLFLFDASSTELIYGVAQMPHTWVEGTTIYPHIHWQKTTSASGDVLWRFEYEIVDDGDIFLKTYFNLSDVTVTNEHAPDDNTAGRSLVSTFDGIDMTGYEISTFIYWKLSRVGGDGSDTYGVDARFAEFDIHYQQNSFGAVDQFTKEYTSA